MRFSTVKYLSRFAFNMLTESYNEFANEQHQISVYTCIEGQSVLQLPLLYAPHLHVCISLYMSSCMYVCIQSQHCQLVCHIELLAPILAFF